MWRTAWTIILAGSILQAQVGQNLTVGHPLIAAMDPAEVEPWILVYDEHDAFRRGTEEKFLLYPKLNPTSQDAETYWGAPPPDNGRFLTTKLEISTPNGFAVTKIEYPPAQRVRLGRQGKLTRVIDSQHAKFRVRLRADNNLVPGDYTVRGKFKFQRIGRVGASEPQELEFEIPIHVVGRQTKVRSNSLYYDQFTAPQRTLIIMAMPILIWFLPQC